MKMIKIILLAVIGFIIFLLLRKSASASGAPAGNPGDTSVEDSIDAAIKKASDMYSVPVPIIKAIIRKESNFNPNAQNPMDPSFGLMQVIPAVFFDFGYIVNYQNPTAAEIAIMMMVENNVMVGTKFLGNLLRKYPFDTAIQMYNVGEAGFNSGHTALFYLADVKRYYDAYKK
jgi:soluble lytic murein transglycosylase-like protein